jgi:integrase/recombinase XerD
MDDQTVRRRGPAPRAMSGPLAVHESALRLGLVHEGYAVSSVRDAVGAMARLSTWMDERGLTAAGLTQPVVERFVSERREKYAVGTTAGRWIGPVMRVLRDAEVAPRPVGDGDDPVEVLLADYRVFLAAERSLAAESVRCYANQGCKFLAHLPEPLDESLAGLTPRDVTAFMVEQSTAAASVWSAKALATALRSLLRYLHLQGLIPRSLAPVVPGAAGWRLSSLPRGLAAGQVQRLLSASELPTPVGLRDRAVLLLLARLGLRGAEVAGLRLTDVAWRTGEITVSGKGGRVETMPLPAEVGAAMADYVRHGRPACRAATVFVTSRAPFKPLSAVCVRAIMGRACVRAGMPRTGAHRLRHTLATDMLRAGAALPEVGQVLRHRSNLSTSIYAKVDDNALRTLARPWPGGAR